MIYSLLSILGTHNKDDMSKTLYAMSTSPESCVAMRQSGSPSDDVDFIDTFINKFISNFINWLTMVKYFKV